MEVLEYNLPESCFPRYQYTKSIRQGLAKRYNDLKNKFGCESMPQLKDIGGANCENISIFFSNPVLEEFPLIRPVLLEKYEGTDPEKIELQEGFGWETLNTHSFIIISESASIGKTVSLEHVPAHAHIILIAQNEEAKTKLSHTTRDSTNIHICLVQLARQEMLSILERYAFTGMKSACEFLDSVLIMLHYQKTQETVSNMKSAKKGSKEDDQSLTKDDFSINSPRKRPLSGQNMLQKCCQTSLNRLQSARGTPRPKSEYDHKETDCRLYEICKETKELRETTERLTDEMVGMFNRSQLPKNEHPCLIISKEKSVDKKLLQDLQALSPLIRRCGYRCSTFQVYVDRDTISDKLKHDIERILKLYKITACSIVSSKINPFAKCRVGSKVSVKLNNADKNLFDGTLGGFARTSSEESDQLWVLMSKHVSKMSGDGNVYINGSEDSFADIMKPDMDPEFDKPYIDITAACVEKNFEKTCDTRYISEKEAPVKGKLCCYDTSELKGLPVHIRGASTPLGLGTVTVPKMNSVQDNCEDKYYIVVEDRDGHGSGEKVQFCKEGDSGAIVCADSPENYGEEVQLISMIVGEDVNKKGSYTTVRLDRGIEELHTRSGKHFNLC